MNIVQIIIVAFAVIAVAVSVVIRIMAVISCMRMGADLDHKTWKRIEHWRD